MKASQFNLLRMPLLRGTNRMTWGRLSFALALVAVGLLARRDPSGLAYAADNPIVIENQQTGSSGWQLATWVSDAQGQIKGYASATSVNKGTPIAKVTTIAGLKPYGLGAQLGTTSYQFIKDTIKPSKQPSVFPQNAGAVQALKNKQIDGLVVDLPTAFYVTAVQVPNSKVLGYFAAKPGGEHFGMVFQKGNSLVQCVNHALATLRSNGTLKQLQQKWLAKATGAPILK